MNNKKTRVSVRNTLIETLFEALRAAGVTLLCVTFALSPVTALDAEKR